MCPRRSGQLLHDVAIRAVPAARCVLRRSGGRVPSAGSGGLVPPARGFRGLVPLRWSLRLGAAPRGFRAYATVSRRCDLASASALHRLSISSSLTRSTNRRIVTSSSPPERKTSVISRAS